MSTYWDVHCMTCDAGWGLHGNHQEEPAVTIALAAPKLADVARLFPEAYIDVELTFQFYGEGARGGPFPVKWFLDHAGHDIQARNEYGATHAQYMAEQALYK